MATRVVFWDFDGTLAQRSGKWTGTLLESLDLVEPGHGITAERLRPELSVDFPWHRPTSPHPELNAPDAWWAGLQRTLAAAAERAGCHSDLARAAAALVRERYPDPTHWSVYPDVVPALAQLSEAGWLHVVLSNHVPELPDLVEGLGLGDRFAAVLTSARCGYEKPHPAIFTLARQVAGWPRLTWMVGDSPTADVAGAQAVGIPALLVRHPDGTTLDRAVDAILESQNQPPPRCPRTARTRGSPVARQTR
jgi:putative hydrolase of the HAD superfamily